MWKLIIVAVIAALFVVNSSFAVGQGHRCFDYDLATKSIKKHYGEVLSAAGITLGGRLLVELWMSPGGVTWSILIVDTRAKVCQVFVGERWLMFKAPLTLEPDDGKK